MNWIKKHSKWVILGITFLIIVIIAIIDIKQIYVALTLIPSVLLSFLQSNNEKQEKLAEMQIEKMKQDELEQEEQEKFEKMRQFVLNFFISVNSGCEFNGIEYESGKNISSKVARHPSYIVLDKIFNLRLSPNMPLYALFLEVQNTARGTAIIPTDRDKDVIDKFNTIDKYYIKILKQELPKILTPDVFDGEKLIVKDE